MELPCKYSAYDYSGAGYFYPSDLAFHIKERGRERDNMMVFRRLDQNGEYFIFNQNEPNHDYVTAIFD